MRHLRLTVLLFLAMVASSMVAVSVSSPADAVTATVYRNVAARNVNDVRTDRDLHALKRAGCLDKFAQRQARRMARKKTIYHQRLETVQSRCGMTYVGETVVVRLQDGPGRRPPRADALRRPPRDPARRALAQAWAPAPRSAAAPGTSACWSRTSSSDPRPRPRVRPLSCERGLTGPDPG